jgi:haemagglutination activity domain protein
LEEIVNGYLSPEPPTNRWQAIGGGINKIVEMCNK